MTPSSMPWASARVSVTLASLATPPGDITRLWDAPVWDRVVLGGRLETERQTVDSFQRAPLVWSALISSALLSRLLGPESNSSASVAAVVSPAVIQ